MNYKAWCRRALQAKGVFREPWLREAFDAVDRTAFVPPRFWVPEKDAEGRYLLMDRDQDDQAWLRAVYDSHQSCVTQLDDGAVAPTGPARGDFTSSVSALDIAFDKLCHLELGAGHRVFEVGSGLGFHTALLCERVGSQHVTAKEIAPELAALGLANLKRAGYAPAVECGDGLQGCAQQAPYDRLISTAAVRDRIPAAWREQMRDGGIILTPFGTAYANAGLLKLTVHDAVASGRFVGGCSYMWVRSQRPRRQVGELGDARTASSALDPREVMQGTWQQDFAIGLHVPDIAYAHRGDGQAKELQLWDERGTSVTQVRYSTWWEPGAVTAWGPRNLWEDVVGAFTAWCEAGRPDITRYGITADAHGQQTWLDNPQHNITDRRRQHHTRRPASVPPGRQPPGD